MLVIRARNVNDAFLKGITLLDRVGYPRESRYGNVTLSDQPVTTVYAKPIERVLFNGIRDANPFFHLYEALWMLDGRSDVEGPARYASRMREFSDDGITFHGAYGYRWRSAFDEDQLVTCINLLRENKNDRR